MVTGNILTSRSQLINSDIISLTIDKLPEGTIFDPQIKLRFALENVSFDSLAIAVFLNAICVI